MQAGEFSMCSRSGNVECFLMCRNGSRRFSVTHHRNQQVLTDRVRRDPFAAISVTHIHNDAALINTTGLVIDHIAYQ